MTAVLACTPNTGRLIPLARALGTVGNSEPAAGIGTVCLLVPANDGRSRRAVEGIDNVETAGGAVLDGVKDVTTIKAVEQRLRVALARVLCRLHEQNLGLQKNQI